MKILDRFRDAKCGADGFHQHFSLLVFVFGAHAMDDATLFAFALFLPLVYTIF
jgi:hypothetical protein